MSLNFQRPIQPIAFNSTPEKVPKLVKTKYIFLNSEFRDSGDINGFNISLPSDYFQKKKNQIIKLSLNSLSLTKQWYETLGGISADFELNGVPMSISDGSYAYDTLLIELNVKLASDFIVTYSYTTNKFTFTKISSNPTLKIINCGYLLGLIDGTTYSNSFTSVNPINVTYSKIVYVNTNLSGNNSLDNVNNKKFSYSTILGSVQIPISSFDIMNYQSFDDNDGIIVSNDQITSVRVFITTERGLSPVLYENFSVSLKIKFYNID